MNSINSFYRKFLSELYQSSRELLKTPMPALPQELFGLYEKTGDRQIYDGFYLTRRKYLAVIGLLALDEKRRLNSVLPEHIQALSRIMEDICQEESWAVPAHVDRTQANWRITADLFACETAQTLSELSDRLSDELPADTRNMVTGNIERRILEPFFSTKTPSFWWEVCNTNWNAVCAGSIGSVCLHLLRNDPEKLDKYLNRIIKSLSHYIDGFSNDGICLEGLGYYTYGMTYFSNFAQELYEYSNGKKDLFTKDWGIDTENNRVEKLSRIAGSLEKCFFPDGKMVCFSDDSSQDTYRLGLYCIMAAHFPGLVFPPVSRAAGLHTDFCYRFAALKMDLLYIPQYMENNSKTTSRRPEKYQSFYIFPDAQWCIGNAASGVGFACKGGNNAEPHNHNDIGHFIYEKDHILFLTDLGAGEYTKEYFGESRYSILCNGSQGHSVPIIYGANQCPGEEYCCGAFRADTGGSVEMELHQAYPKGLLKKYIREFHFDLQTGNLLIEDFFQFQESVPKASASSSVLNAYLTENLVTQIEPVITERGILLTQNGVRALITFQDPLRPPVYVKKYDHKNPKAESEDVYAIQWHLAVHEGTARCSFSITVK